MMKKLLMMLGAAFIWCGLTVAPLAAQDTDAASATEETDSMDEAEEEPSVSILDMLKEVEYATKAKPKKKVYVYFFVRSHSGCGPCRAMVPSSISLYKEMKGKGAEIIMLNGDANAAKAKEWAEEAEMNFPVITPETCKHVNVPSGGSGGTPNVVAVTEDGEVLDNASGYKKCPEVMGNWKDLVKQAKKSAREKKAKDKKKKSKKKSKKSKKKDDASAEDDAAPSEADF